MSSDSKANSTSPVPQGSIFRIRIALWLSDTALHRGVARHRRVSYLAQPHRLRQKQMQGAGFDAGRHSGKDMRIRQTVETSSRLPRPPALAIMSSATLLGAASILEAAETAPRARLRDGNDDPSCHEADKPDSPATAVRSAFNPEHCSLRPCPTVSNPQRPRSRAMLRNCARLSTSRHSLTLQWVFQ